MARICSHCGTSVEDNEKVFCPNCGEFIDKDLNLIKTLDKTLDKYDKNAKANAPKKESKPEPYQNVNRHTDGDDTVTKLKKQQSSGMNTGLIAVIIVIIIVIILALVFLL